MASPSLFANWQEPIRAQFSKGKQLMVIVQLSMSITMVFEDIWWLTLWHKASRFWRKILTHAVCVKINMKRGNMPLQFERILAWKIRTSRCVYCFNDGQAYSKNARCSNFLCTYFNVCFRRWRSAMELSRRIFQDFIQKIQKTFERSILSVLQKAFS